MKTLILAVTSVLTFHLQSALAVSPEEEARFLAAVRQGFEKQDPNAIFTLTCWDRMSDKNLKGSKDDLVKYITTMKVSDIKLLEPSSKFSGWFCIIPDGTEYRYNLPVIKQVTITFAPGGSVTSEDFPVGEKGGKLYLVEPAPTK